MTDGRFSGGSHGFIVGHVCPEAAVGGPIGLVRNGDKITVDISQLAINVDISDDELQQRRSAWVQPEPRVKSGYLYKYAKLVNSASQGCTTDR